jgi:tetratricopeptide (TPR) repeat protein
VNRSHNLRLPALLCRRFPVLLVLLFTPMLIAVARSGQESVTSRDQIVLQIQHLIETRDLAEARRRLAQAAKQFPSDAGFDNLFGILEAQQGHYAAAEGSFTRAIQRQPKFTSACLNLGRLYQENFATDPRARQKALDVYSSVLAYDPGNAEANYQTAVLLLQQNRYRGSLDHLARLSDDIRANPQALSVACADYAGLGDRAQTDAAAARLIASADLSEPDALQAVPALEVAVRDDLIISLFEALEARQPLSQAAVHSLGLAYERSGRFVESRAALERFATGENLSVAALLELARVAHKQKDYQGSLGYLAHARDLQPLNARLHFDFGSVCLDLNLLAEARKSFERAVTLEPENPSYNYAMGTASSFRHDPAEAIPYFEKYRRLKPQDPRGSLALGIALFRAKDYDAAKPWLLAAAQVPQLSATAHYYLGSIGLQENQLDDAFNELQQALKISPNYPNALAELGQYYLIRKDYEPAERHLHRALELDPDNYSANFYALTLYTRTKDPRREAQAKHFDELQKLLGQKMDEFLRIVEARPLESQ